MFSMVSRERGVTGGVDITVLRSRAGTLQFRVQPRLGEGPVALHGDDGDVQVARDLVVFEPAEVFELHDLRLACIELRELLQRFIELDDLSRRLREYQRCFLELNGARAGPPLLA